MGHISMGLMRNDGEMRRRHRFADQTVLDEPKQRARLLWKNRKRFVAPPADAPEHDWRALQTVWPRHSLRSDDWTVVPCEAQPTRPMKARGVGHRTSAFLKSRPCGLTKVLAVVDDRSHRLSKERLVFVLRLGRVLGQVPWQAAFQRQGR